MRLKRRRLPNFESCSVALFASLVLCGPLPSRAQGAGLSGTPSNVRPVVRALAWRPTPSTPPRSQPARVEPDGSVSSPGFDEALK